MSKIEPRFISSDISTPSNDAWCNLGKTNLTNISSTILTFTSLPNPEILKVGMPIRFTLGGVNTYHYAYIISVNNSTPPNTIIELSGKIPTSIDDLNKLEYGSIRNIVHVDFSANGNYAKTIGLLLSSVSKTYFSWAVGDAHVVGFKLINITNDTGAVQPSMQLNINGTNIPNISLFGSTTWSIFKNISIAENVKISYGQSMDLSVESLGTNTNSSDLTASVILVLE